MRKKKRKDYERDLLFYLKFFKKFPPETRDKFQCEIDTLIELLKELD